MLGAGNEPLTARRDRMESVVTPFVQIIEFKTSRIDELQALANEMRSEHGAGTALRGTATADRDRPGYYLNIVEFESRESAMENSARPEIGQFAARMAALCDEPPRFYNLDVIETWEGESGGPSMKTVVAGAATAAAGVAAAAAAAKSRSGGETGDEELAAVDYVEPPPVVVSETTGEAPGPVFTTESGDYSDTQDRPL